MLLLILSPSHRDKKLMLKSHFIRLPLEFDSNIQGVLN